MPIYALAMVPLIRELSTFAKTRQVWYADVSVAAGKISDIQQWWDILTSRNPSFGYFASAKKTWLLVKESSLSMGRDLFNATEVNVTTEGRPYLSAPLGTLQYSEGFVEAKVDTWRTVILSLTETASSQPHAAYSAFTHGLSNLWFFLRRTTPNIHHL